MNYPVATNQEKEYWKQLCDEQYRGSKLGSEHRREAVAGLLNSPHFMALAKILDSYYASAPMVARGWFSEDLSDQEVVSSAGDYGSNEAEAQSFISSAAYVIVRFAAQEDVEAPHYNQNLKARAYAVLSLSSVYTEDFGMSIDLLDAAFEYSNEDDPILSHLQGQAEELEAPEYWDLSDELVDGAVSRLEAE